MNDVMPDRKALRDVIATFKERDPQLARDLRATVQAADPMEYAIEDLLAHVNERGWSTIGLRRMVGLALNEAFRNGARTERQRHEQQADIGEDAGPPDNVSVTIDGLENPDEASRYGRWTARRVGESDVYRLDGDVPAAVLDEHVCDEPIGVYVVIPGLAQFNEPGGVARRDWWARRRINEHATNETSGATYPVYEMVGDPSAVAIGRFKANARKMLSQLFGVTLG